MTEASTTLHRPATLSRDLSEFLVEFSIGVHRYVMYPPGHPSLAPVVESIVARLGEILHHRRTLDIGVAQRQLIIEGVATEQGHPVLSDLALRLHDHQLGALSLELGVTATEIGGLLAALALETERGGSALGLLPPDELPDWEHARLHRVGYERLELRADGSAAPVGKGWADDLWLGLAQATLGGHGDDLAEVQGSELATSVASKQGHAAYEQAIADYLRRIPRELKGRDGVESERLRQKVADFIRQLDDETLGRLVGFGDAQQRRDFLLDANQSLAVDSVVRVLKAAASADQQNISHSMTRMLNKLARHAEQGTGTQQSQADTALRENVESLIEGWSLEDPNPDAYTNVLDALSASAPIFHPPDDEEERITGAQRLVEMALEVDSYGPIVAKAVTDFMEEGGAGALMQMVREAAPGSQVATEIRSLVTAPQQFRHLLAQGKVDDQGLQGLLDEMGTDAVAPLLDVLAESQDRRVRRRVFDALLSLGPVVGERAVARLAGSPWFVQRNMLALLQRLGDLPQGFDPQPFLRHDDPRVRREAFPLALRVGSHDRVLVAALTDPDERMVRMGLAELQSGVPDPVLPTLVNRVVRSHDRPPEVRAQAVKVLAHSRSPLALNTLVEMTTGGKTLLGKPKLAAPSREVLAALRVLAVAWSQREEAKDILEQAAKAKDPEVRGAVHVTASSLARSGMGEGP